MQIQLKKGQSTLELALSAFLALMLFLAVAQALLWLTSRIVRRQVQYEARRADAGNVSPDNPQEIQVDEASLGGDLSFYYIKR